MSAAENSLCCCAATTLAASAASKRCKQIIKKGFSAFENRFYAPIAMRGNDIEETKTAKLFLVKF